MKILITNDDGFDKLGIRLLAEWAKTIGEVTVIAPKMEQSAKSHAIEIRNPIEVKKVHITDGVKAYSMSSTPADCIRFGLTTLKEKFDLVLSGINSGLNVGVDIVYSGTLGAIFEAARLGVPAIGFSSFPNTLEAAATYLGQVYDYIVKNNLFAKNPIYNVNLPEKSKGIRMTYQGSPYFSDEFEKIDGQENMYMPAGVPIEDVCPDDIDRDTVAIHKGYISVTPLISTRTNMQVVEEFRTKD